MQNQGFESQEPDYLKRNENQNNKERLYKTDFFNKHKTTQGEENKGLVLSPEHTTKSPSIELTDRPLGDTASVDSSDYVGVPNLGVRHPKGELLVALNNYTNNVVNLRRLYFQQAMNQIEEMVNKVLVNIEHNEGGLRFRHMSPSCFYEIKAHNEIDVYLVLEGISPSDVIIEEVASPVDYARVRMVTTSAVEEVELIDDGEISAPVSLIHAMTSSVTSPMSYPMSSSITSLVMSPTTSTPEKSTEPLPSSPPMQPTSSPNVTSHIMSSVVAAGSTSHMTSSNDVATDSTSRMMSSVDIAADSAPHNNFAKYCVNNEEGDVYLSAKRICKKFATLVNKASIDALKSASDSLPFSTADQLLNLNSCGHPVGSITNNEDVEGKDKKKLKKKVSFKKTFSFIEEVSDFPEFSTVTSPYVINLIPTIECPQLWPNCSSWLKTCSRKWPDTDLKQKIVSQGVHLAAIPTTQDKDIWQIKFLNGRRCLIHHEGNESKAKCLRILKVLCENDLSYPKAIVPLFLENIMMWASRKYWKSNDWTEANLPARFLELMAGLHKCIKNGDCHDFFLPSVNLFADLDRSDLDILSHKVMDILVDPFKYLD